MNRRISIILLLIAVICLLKVDNLQAQEEFKGSRSTRCIVSQSDLNNFVLGGRAALEMILAQEKVQRCMIRTRSIGTNLEVYIEYTFNTYEEYKDITQKLLGHEPITTYGEINVPYMENFTPLELFNFLNDCMEKSEVIEEIRFLKLLKVEKDTMVINGDTYEDIGALNTSDEEKIIFNNIEINTELSDNIYTRTIEFSMEEDQIQRILQVIKERCSSNDMELQENGATNSIVTFSADSEPQLIKKTMLLLGVPVNISHKKYFNTKKTVRMETKESLDVESILTEGGQFSYELILPESYVNLSANLKSTEKEEKENTSVVSGKVCSNGREGEITFYYDASPAFDNISIFTDVSDESYKIKRTITFCMDWNIADEYYETVKKELKKRLDNGDILKIYDNQGYRYYEITHSSWSEKEIEMFTNRIFKMNNSTLKIKRSALPFVKSRIQDKFNIKEGNIEDYSGTVDIKYMLPSNTKVTGEINEGEEGKNISLISKLQVTSDIEFLCFHYGKCVIYILGIIVTSMVVFLCIGYMRKHFGEPTTKSMRMRKKSYRNNRSEHCSKCGSERKHGAVFCWKCGSKIQKTTHSNIVSTIFFFIVLFVVLTAGSIWLFMRKTDNRKYDSEEIKNVQEARSKALESTKSMESKEEESSNGQGKNDSEDMNVNSAEQKDSIDKALDYNDETPFQQQYWVIFTEGFRNNRIEASSIDSTFPAEQLTIIWDSALDLSDTSGSDGCDQYYLDESGVWVYMGKYHRLTDNASHVIASNLDIVNPNGDIVIPQSPYSMVSWKEIEYYK